ncbi:HAD family hydrolase [Desulfopila sp. IMCC35008]|uniref:HAD family hydrolase n=1 Tax=Desulfopila sp. IMCC35008 TaxID=2653858 RepID=UPI0013D744D1|nr:HAD hydrolase-like protein [Desulfopila sp. IMCC35008]
MNIRYKCLILDHDDTVVDSTSSIHYPAHLEIMKRLRPEQTPVSLEEWFLKNYNPGIFEYYTDELGFDDEEIEQEYTIWREFTQTKIPEFYDGFMDMLAEYKARGGIITVVSHSDVDIIRSHYRHHSNSTPIEPEIIFGWHVDSEKRKPSPYPVECILDEFQITSEDALILDDLKPGVKMGGATGVSVAAAGWGHQIPEIRLDMEGICDFYFTRVDEFRTFLLG